MTVPTGATVNIIVQTKLQIEIEAKSGMMLTMSLHLDQLGLQLEESDRDMVSLHPVLAPLIAASTHACVAQPPILSMCQFTSYICVSVCASASRFVMDPRC